MAAAELPSAKICKCFIIPQSYINTVYGRNHIEVTLIVGLSRAFIVHWAALHTVF